MAPLDIAPAVAVVNAYLSAKDDHEEAMERARRATDEHGTGEVIDSLVLLNVALLAIGVGDKGGSTRDTLQRVTHITDMTNKSYLESTESPEQPDRSPSGLDDIAQAMGDAYSRLRRHRTE